MTPHMILYGNGGVMNYELFTHIIRFPHTILGHVTVTMIPHVIPYGNMGREYGAICYSRDPHGRISSLGISVDLYMMLGEEFL